MLNELYNNLPEYSDTMYLQGYSANQVYQAFKKSLYEKLNAEKTQKEDQNIIISIISEVK